jgi:hypothetical protein
MVLAFLGDGAFLVERARAGSRNAITGICGALRAFADQAQKESGERIPLGPAYGWLQSLLDSGDDSQQRAIESELKPGTGFRAEIDALDLDALLAALTSRHAVIRWHAAGVLGDMKLPKKQARPVVDALIPLIADRSAFVRRLAMLALEDHERHLLPAHWQAMADRSAETDPVARSVAERAAKHLGDDGK